MIRAALAGLLLVIGMGPVGVQPGPAPERELVAAGHGPEPVVTVTATPGQRQGSGETGSGWPWWILSGIAGGGAVLLGQVLLRRRARAAADGRTPLGPLPQPLPVLLAGGADSRAPGVALDGGMLAQTTVRAVSLRGRRHRYRGEPLQDAYAVRLSADGRWVIAAVADGLGSTLHAEHAAAVAVRAATNLALTPGLGWHAAFATIAGEVMRATARLGDRRTGRHGAGASDPPATTLTIGVVPADGRRGIAACAAIGDSPALWLHDGTWTELFPPEGRPGNVRSIGGREMCSSCAATASEQPWAAAEACSPSGSSPRGAPRPRCAASCATWTSICRPTTTTGRFWRCGRAVTTRPSCDRSAAAAA
jgi:hypothetical protein